MWDTGNIWAHLFHAQFTYKAKKQRCNLLCEPYSTAMRGFFIAPMHELLILDEFLIMTGILLYVVSTARGFLGLPFLDSPRAK